MNKHPILGFSAGGIFALAAWISPNTPLKGLSAVASLLALGYGSGAIASLQASAIAKTRLERELRDRYTEQLNQSNTELAELHRQLSEASQQRQADKEVLIERYSQALEAHKLVFNTECQRANQEALEREIAALEGQKQDYYRECLGKIKARNSEHRRREQWLIAQIEEVSGKLEGANENHRGELSALVQKYETLLDEYQRVLDSYHPEIQEIQALFAQQMEDVVGERDRVYQTLLSANAPRKFIGYGRIAELGNDLIDWLGERGILVDPIDCKGHTGGWATVTLRPRNATLEQVERLKSSIWLEFALLGEPKASIKEGAIEFSLHIDSAPGKTSSTPGQAPKDWFPKAVRACQHLRVTGERDSGKSTLVSNLVDLKQIQNPEIVIRLCNPNYGSPKDGWNLPTEWKSYEEAIAGLQAASELVLERNREAREAKDAGLPCPHFEPVLFIFDELESIVSWHKDTAPTYLKNCLTKGTHYGVHILYITQSPLASALRLNQPDLNHSAGLHLGKNIARVVDNNRMLAESGRNKLKAQYEQMTSNGDKYLVLCEYDNQRFIAPTPAPNFYQEPKMGVDDLPAPSTELEALRVGGCSASVDGERISPDRLKTPEISRGDQITDRVLCPQCGSSSIRRNGRTAQGEQRYQCKDCHRNFKV